MLNEEALHLYFECLKIRFVRLGLLINGKCNIWCIFQDDVIYSVAEQLRTLLNVLVVREVLAR